VLGFPASRNLGDADGAARAYVAMAEIARELYEGDPHDARAAVDYAIALMRAGTVTPLERATDKQQLLERALSVGETVLASAPDDIGMRVNAAFMAIQLGQVFRDTSRWTEAAGSYRRAMRLAEPLLASGNVSATATFSTARGQLAIIEARMGRGAAAITLVNAAISWAERIASRHTDPQILGQRYLLARAYGDRAAVHALLGDAAAAREWRLKARIAWRELEGSRGFTEQHAREARALDGSPQPD
jgi:tetratricopeptide (TPR) repeat protein